MKLLIESWRKFVSEAQEVKPGVVTVDFDDTIRMTDGTPNPIVIQKIKKYKADGAKVYIVTSRRSTDDNRLFISDFLDEENVMHDGIHLTNTKVKWYTIKDLGSNMHFDDDNTEFRAIMDGIADLGTEPDLKLMKVDSGTGQPTEWKEDLDEIIRKTKDKEEHCLKSKKGKSLGCYPSKTAAKKREKQVNYFKHKGK